MRYVRIKSTDQLIDLLDRALGERNMTAAEFHKRSGMSGSYMSTLRSGQTQNIGSQNLLAMLDTLGLRLVVEDPTHPDAREPSRPTHDPAIVSTPVVEDMRVDQHYGWVPDATGQNVVWGKTIYEIVFKVGGEWRKLPVRHVNPEPPKKDK